MADSSVVANRANQAPTSSQTAIAPVVDELVQGVTTANADNLSAARWSASVAEELTVFMTHAKVKAMLKKEKEKASACQFR